METDKIVLPIVMTKNFTRKLSKGDSTKKNKKKRIVSSPKIYDADDHEEIYNSSVDLNAILGTMIAFALGRHKFKGRSTTNLLIFLPMATPEIVLGASLLSLFLVFKINPGFWPTVIAHVLFCVSFVVVTVKARIASLDPRLEQAAMDLYANERETFRRVTLPLVAPGIAAAALLAFSLSFDDFIITNFNSGTMTTFPKFVYTSAARGIPAQANVIGSAMFFLALAIVIIGQFVGRKRKVS